MRIRIGGPLEGTEQPRSIHFDDLLELLAEQQLRINDVAFHRRDDPAIPAAFENDPPADAAYDVPLNLRIDPYEGHRILDRKIVFLGLREFLEQRFGRVMGTPRQGDDIAARVRLVPMGGVGNAWSREEVVATVADYFAMLDDELAEREYSKADHRRQLLARLNGRSAAAVEYKHQNISAVLQELELPYIDGYKPAANYQELLYDVVEELLGAQPGLRERLLAAPMLNPVEPPPPTELTFEELLLAPPPRPEPRQGIRRPRLIKRGGIAARDAANRQLGELGEAWVIQLERRRLVAAGRPDLAERVHQVEVDGLGYDIVSFEEDERERLIEVKTTGAAHSTPFILTANEVETSVLVPDQYYLYRVFDFKTRPRFYLLAGSLRGSCQLESLTYRATP